VKKNLVLLGMMAVGKTTLGKIVAKTKGLEFIDTDKTIEQKNSMTINEIFKKKGEKFFRKEEENIILKSLKKRNCVVALGGGAFINKNIRENVLKSAVSIWLDIDTKVLDKRAKWSKKRPLLVNDKRSKKINELYAERKNIYKLADYKIKCDELSKEKVTRKIIEIYEKY